MGEQGTDELWLRAKEVRKLIGPMDCKVGEAYNIALAKGSYNGWLFERRDVPEDRRAHRKQKYEYRVRKAEVVDVSAPADPKPRSRASKKQKAIDLGWVSASVLADALGVTPGAITSAAQRTHGRVQGLAAKRKGTYPNTMFRVEREKPLAVGEWGSCTQAKALMGVKSIKDRRVRTAKNGSSAGWMVERMERDGARSSYRCMPCLEADVLGAMDSSRLQSAARFYGVAEKGTKGEVLERLLELGSRLSGTPEMYRAVCSLSRQSRKQLRSECREVGLQVGGTKGDLLRRLLESRFSSGATPIVAGSAPQPVEPESGPEAEVDELPVVPEEAKTPFELAVDAGCPFSAGVGQAAAARMMGVRSSTVPTHAERGAYKGWRIRRSDGRAPHFDIAWAGEGEPPAPLDVGAKKHRYASRLEPVELPELERGPTEADRVAERLDALVALGVLRHQMGEEVEALVSSASRLLKSKEQDNG